MQVTGTEQDLPFQLHQFSHCLLHRSVAVETVDVEEINVVSAKLLEARLATRAAVLGRAIDHNFDLAVCDLPPETKLCGQKDVLAALWVKRKPLADEDLAVPIACSSVPEGRSQLPGAVENLEAILVGPEIRKSVDISLGCVEYSCEYWLTGLVRKRH